MKKVAIHWSWRNAGGWTLHYLGANSTILEQLEFYSWKFFSKYLSQVIAVREFDYKLVMVTNQGWTGNKIILEENILANTKRKSLRLSKWKELCFWNYHRQTMPAENSPTRKLGTAPSPTTCKGITIWQILWSETCRATDVQLAELRGAKAISLKKKNRMCWINF